MAPFHPTPRSPLPPFATLSRTQKSKIILLTFFALATIIGFYISFPLIIVYGGGPEKIWTPRDIKCAPCEEIWARNERLAEGLECVLGNDGGNHEKKLATGMERCWTLQPGKGEWESSMA